MNLMQALGYKRLRSLGVSGSLLGPSKKMIIFYFLFGFPYKNNVTLYPTRTQVYGVGLATAKTSQKTLTMEVMCGPQ